MCVGLVQTHRAFAYNNAWANHRLLGASAELTQGEFEAARLGFFPSLQGTLNNIKPPQLDEFFSIAEAPLRASDFAGLGWTEETVWGSNA
jgi:uncharacterized damage-inducible protein DinB